ncbi:hypothetical protein F4808DRAFT_59163 [Astrocystis sublimbata]|nr:hypothetical protein F4808DRAFT_59163 [Astrocystis sublimbata]
MAAATMYKDDTQGTVKTPVKMTTARNITRNSMKDQLRLSSNGKHFPPPLCPPPNYPPPSPPKQTRRQHAANESRKSTGAVSISETGRAQEVTRRCSGMIVNDFSLASASRPAHTLLNPYDTETADNCADAGMDNTDLDIGGWLALHQRRHQRAFAPYMAAAAKAAGKRAVSPDNPLSRAHAEILRMALDFEAENRNENPNSAASGSTALSSSARKGSPSPGGATDPPPRAGSLGERNPRSSFLDRCGKVIVRKRSFWRRDETELS